MKPRNCALASFLILFSAACWSYGGGGGGASCAEPKFLTESPANHSTVPSFADFSFVASDVEPQSLSVKINGTVVAPTVTPMANGDLQVAVHLDSPVTTPGKVQIAADAKSKEGCFGFKAFYVEVK